MVLPSVPQNLRVECGVETEPKTVGNFVRALLHTGSLLISELLAKVVGEQDRRDEVASGCRTDRLS